MHHILFYQRPLKQVDPGRCSFLPEYKRAPKALPLFQHFRIYQEVNNLRYVGENLENTPLTLEQRNKIVNELKRNGKRTFDQIRKLLEFPGTVRFNIEDERRKELDGDKTAAILSKKALLGKRWFEFSFEQQNQIVEKLLYEEDEILLVDWLVENLQVSKDIAEQLSNISLPDGYGQFSKEALERIVPELRKGVVLYSDAVVNAGFRSHSALERFRDGEVFSALPYYGEVLERYISLGTNNPEDRDEIRYGRISNPTVHIGLNQLRLLVNALIKEYGNPTQVVLEVARDLKLSKKEKEQVAKQQAENQKKNKLRKEEIAGLLGKTVDRVTREELQKLILWEELAFSPSERCCPYTGKPITKEKLFGPEVEIEHIIPFSRTLDDSMNNKTVAFSWANRAKGNRTPYEAFKDNQVEGIKYSDIVHRASNMKKEKRYRFAEDAYEQWLRKDNNFLARALNDTRYLSRVAKEYISLVCPMGTWVIPGQLTAMLRGKLGLNTVLNKHSTEKSRDDHRHHAVDACVIGITDRATLQRFAYENTRLAEGQKSRLIYTISPPWPTFRNQVERAIENIWVSFKPDHSYEGCMHNDTAYGLDGDGLVHYHKMENGKRIFISQVLDVIPITCNKANKRHGLLPDGSPKPYKGYKGDSNFCMEIFKNEKGIWSSRVVSTYEAYQIVRKNGEQRLYDKKFTQDGKPLVMRLMRNDLIRLEEEGKEEVYRICNMRTNGSLSLAKHTEANVDKRDRDKENSFKYLSKTASVLQKLKARLVTVSISGCLRDKGFKD